MKTKSTKKQIKELDDAFDEIANTYIERRVYLLLLYKMETGLDYDGPLPLEPIKYEHEPEKIRTNNLAGRPKGTIGRQIWDFMSVNGPSFKKELRQVLGLSEQQVTNALKNNKCFRGTAIWGQWEIVPNENGGKESTEEQMESDLCRTSIPISIGRVAQ